MRNIVRTTAAGLAALLSLGLLAAPAHAGTTTLNGTVNCNGSRTTYATVRYMDEPSRTDLFLSKAAGGKRSGYAMDIGTYIVANGRLHTAYFAGANSYGTLQSRNNYVKGTRFRMSAKMYKASAGECSNTWAGTLYY